MLDPDARRLGGGRRLLGGEPARLVTLSTAGAAALDHLLGAASSAPVAGEASLAGRLAAAGLIHPVVEPAPSLATLGVVIPAHDPPPSIERLVVALAAGGLADLVVVDDGSPARCAELFARLGGLGARVVSREAAGGPAAARNAAGCEGEVVAFLDADTELPDADPLGPLRLLAAHFADGGVGAVAPRIRSLPRAPGALGRYEAARSPLDLGEAPGLVGAGRRLSYVPAAGLLVRRQVLTEVGGFDESLRYGEDVELVRRITAAGHLVRYEPRAVVHHRPRESLAAFARQRFGYGSAAAAIDRRAPGTVPPFVASPLPAAAGAGLLALAVAPTRPAVWALAGGLVGGSVASTAHRLAPLGLDEHGALARELARRSVVGAAGGLLVAVRRCWWPLVLCATALPLTRRPAARLLVLATAAGHLRPAAREEGWPARLGHLGLGALDDACYGAGVLAGMVSERSSRAWWPAIRRRPRGPRVS